MPLSISGVFEPLAAVREALLASSPEEMLRCLPALSAACRVVADLPRSPDPDLRSALEALLREIRRTRSLIEHGAALYSGCAALLGVSASGYTSTGEPAPLAASAAISVRG